MNNFHVCWDYSKRRWVVTLTGPGSGWKPKLAIRTYSRRASAHSVKRLLNNDREAHRLAMAELLPAAV